MSAPATAEDIQAATGILALLVTVGMAANAYVAKRREDDRRSREEEIAEALKSADTAHEIRGIGDKLDRIDKRFSDHIEEDRKNFESLHRALKRNPPPSHAVIVSGE